MVITKGGRGRPSRASIFEAVEQSTAELRRSMPLDLPWTVAMAPGYCLLVATDS